MDWKRQAVKNKEKQRADMEKRRAFLGENAGKELEDYRIQYNIKMSELRLRQYEEDPACNARKTVMCQCKYCTYMSDGFAGRAMTHYQCQECGRQELYHSTDVPMLCTDCGLRLGVCVDCGNEL